MKLQHRATGRKGDVKSEGKKERLEKRRGKKLVGNK